MKKIKRNHQKELSKIRQAHYEEIKRNIYELIAYINEFPTLFEIKYRISILDENNKELRKNDKNNNKKYARILESKENIKSFKNEFHKKSIKFKSCLIYLFDDYEEKQNLFMEIINELNNIELYLQKLDSILNLTYLKGGLGYSEQDYETIINNMYLLKENIGKLPEDITLNKKFIDISTQTLNYYDCIIRCSQKIGKIYKEQNDVTINSLKDNLDINFKKEISELSKKIYINKPDEGFRDSIKIWVLFHDIENKRSYTCIGGKNIKISRAK